MREAEIEIGKRGSVGIGTPGALSPATHRIRNSNSTCLNGRALKEDSSALLGREIRIANDANCFALSEAIDGAARDAAIAFGVILGTGVGGGVVVHGRVLEGVNAIAGEWGHNALPWPEAAELPGRRAIAARTAASRRFFPVPGLALDHERASGREACCRRDRSRAMRRAIAGRRQTMARYENRLARALASVINVLDPHVIVLGGGLSNIERLYANVPQLWGEWVFSDVVRTRLVRNYHGDSSGVRGAAWLWET